MNKRKLIDILISIVVFIISYSILGFICKKMDIVYGTLNSIAFFSSLIIGKVVYNIMKKKCKSNDR